jgi:hypothetical protein
MVPSGPATAAPAHSRIPPAWRLPAAAALLGGIYFLFALHAARKISHGSVGDFQHFYYAADAMRRGQDLYASWHHGYLYPPLWAFLILPLAWLDLDQAARVQLALSAAVSVLALLLASRESQRRILGHSTLLGTCAGALLAAIVLYGPLSADLAMGQTNAWVLLALVTGLITLDRRPALAGAALGFAFSIKFQAIAFLPYLLIRRRTIAAAWFVLSVLILNLLPAAAMGWSGNLHGLAVAYSGVLDLLGVKTGLAVAKNPMDAPFSISITSAMARLLGPGHEFGAIALSLAVIALCAGAAWGLYRRHGIPMLRWPPAPDQAAQPWSSMIAAEWSGLIVLALAFSPQTNPRHLALLACPVTLGAALLIASPRRVRPLISASLLVLFLAISFPPSGEWSRPVARWWTGIGGRSWGVLACYAVLLAVAAHRKSIPWQARAPRHRPVDAAAPADAQA